MHINRSHSPKEAASFAAFLWGLFLLVAELWSLLPQLTCTFILSISTLHFDPMVWWSGLSLMGGLLLMSRRPIHFSDWKVLIFILWPYF